MGWILQNDLLVVEIDGIGPERGTRFDRTGSVRQVRLKQGGHTFCAPESLVPGQGTGGQGLYNEFGITMPVGYSDCGVGERFPKLGIGLLTRPDEAPYDFFRTYPLEAYDVIVKAEEAAITFDVLPMGCRGYAAHLHKKLTLVDNRLRIDYMLVNEGMRPIVTNEYVHNFMGMGGFGIGPDYILRFPVPVTVEEIGTEHTNEVLQFSGDEIRWKAQPVSDFYVRLGGGVGGPHPFSWELRHEPSGLGVRESGNFPVAELAVWGKGHVVSPEMFIHIDLAPGHTMEWGREYEFFQKISR